MATAPDYDVDFDFDDTPQISITREMVAACSDLETLAHWFESLDARALTIKEFWDAFKDTDLKNDDWKRRHCGALAYNNIGLRWVERRILALGGKPPYPPTDPRGQQIYSLMEEVRKLRVENERLRNPRDLATLDTNASERGRG